MAYGVTGKAGVSYLASDKVDLFVQGEYSTTLASTSGAFVTGGDSGPFDVSGGLRIRL